ncbi:TetR/AcrR family transcriptional regulator [Promicromonospora sp. MEB111]|uniref:TetR/AcrR family transcriptional regulator n=1 Tax=Promicromonospora sp. MEB111 TaxID=3040301 RepID=UPI00254A1632|nr:TetR/AcrR family transcriptional regulator [Promicromonospora sp. MEB111]
MAQILQAAARVLGEQGYERTTTNAIAAEAGISPGSLYQFFNNKDEIVTALAERYAHALAAFQADALDEGSSAHDGAPRGTAEVVVGVIEPLVEFNLDHPGFKALFGRADLPASLTTAVRPVQELLEHRVTGLLSQVVPGLEGEALGRAATMCIQITRAGMPLIVAPGADRPAMTAELHAALTAYIDSLRARVP